MGVEEKGEKISTSATANTEGTQGGHFLQADKRPLSAKSVFTGPGRAERPGGHSRASDISARGGRTCGSVVSGGAGRDGVGEDLAFHGNLFAAGTAFPAAGG